MGPRLVQAPTMLYPFPPLIGSSSHWGPIQTIAQLGRDAVIVTTASHGGLRVSLTALARMPEPLRQTAYSRDGWFEEDCDWALPYLALGLHAFEPNPARAEAVRAAATRTVQVCHAQHSGCWPPCSWNGPMAEPDQPAFGVAEATAVAPPSSQSSIADLRQRLMAHGAEALDEGETLQLILIRCLPRGADAASVADALIERFGDIGHVFGAPRTDLARVVGPDVAAELDLCQALLLRTLEHPLRQREVLSSWQAVKTYLRARLTAAPREAFHVLFLDKKNRLIADERLGAGTVDHAPVYPREVVRRALELSASAMLLAHNHPSGDPTPSAADIDMTRQVVAAAKALGIVVHDHFVVGGDEVASLRALGLM